MAIINKEDIDLLEKLLIDTANEIVAIQQAKGLKASGRSAEELNVNMNEGVGQIVDPTGSFEYQERGRGPGGINVKAIYDWLQWKKYGINWDSEKERKQIAFAIANKIRKLGTKTHIDKVVTGVISQPINDNTIQAFISTLAERKSIEIKSDIIEGFKP